MLLYLSDKIVPLYHTNQLNIMTQTKTINELKTSIMSYVRFMVKKTKYGNNTYQDVADTIYRDEIYPYVKNDNITGWEVDIKGKFLNGINVPYEISEKQAYCLARAFAQLNPETIK